ncbi:MAG TPA: phenylalanine--tRNA ligase subunit beta [Acidimicrobiales bacterium]|nr:phenylalanine--tRNA ligase subunit beta [Acidimicrobiales bacterium]
MLVPLSWLRDFAPFDLDPVALGEVFDDLGMVVESITRVGEGLDGVVVARVVAIEPIPGADKIRKVRVDAGSGTELEIVCGAWNMTEGDSVPLAPVGTVLPNGMAITRRKMKGVVSDGMLCSATELGLGDDAAGLLVLPEPAAPPGTPVRDALGIEPDVVYDLAIEANRPDANCIAGVARDAAARLGLPFAIPPVPPLGDEGDAAFRVVLGAPELCDRFTATVFDGVVVAPSPAWVARRLTLAGMRPISNVVDASNYVMLELGQPTHAYDLDRLPAPVLGARAARPGERLVTLDGVERVLGTGAHPDCVIVDGDDTVIGIGGVMGGASSEVHDGTTRVVLEAAHFTPMAIARTSKRLGLRSEASARFERGVDVDGVHRAAARFAELLGETAPGLRVRGATVDEVAPGATDRAVVHVRVARVNALLGAALGEEDVRRYLAPIGFEVGADGGGAAGGVEGGALRVVVPTFRPDVRAEVDVIEEVARHHGYARIARTTVRPPQVGRLTPYQRARRDAREVLRGAGLSEASVGPLLAPGDHARAGLPEPTIVAVDPLAREESVLRASLRPGLLRAAAFNHARRNGDLGLFELGMVWAAAQGATATGPGAAPGRGLPEEREMCAVLLAGAGPFGTGADARAAVRVLWRLVAGWRVEGVRLETAEAPGLHPTRTARVVVRGAPAGWVGEIDPDVATGWGLEPPVGWLEVSMAELFAARRESEEARPVSRYPSSDRDLAFVVDDRVAAADVEAALARAAGELLERVWLFDTYRGPGVREGARSLAFRLRFSALDRTLTDAEIDAARQRAIEAVEREFGAAIRA